MKVEEAKTRVCPFIMGSGSINFDEPISNNDTTANINCICGDCMAWEYTKTHTTKAITSYEDGKPNTQCLHNDEELLENSKEGYCKRLRQ